MQGVTYLANPEKKRKMNWTKKSEKPPLLLTKTGNQKLNWKKTANSTRLLNRKAAASSGKPKTEPKIGQIRNDPKTRDLVASLISSNNLITSGITREHLNLEHKLHLTHEPLKEKERNYFTKYFHEKLELTSYVHLSSQREN